MKMFQVLSFVAAPIAACIAAIGPAYGQSEREAPKAIATEITDQSKAADIPIHLHTAHIFIDVKINGQGPYSFALDTGAPYSAIDSRVAEETKLKLGPPVNAGGSGENVRQANFVAGVNVGLSGVNLANQSIVALSLSDFEPILGRKVDGILGIDLFQSFVVEIDYGVSRLRVFDFDRYEYKGKSKAIPIVTDSRRCRAKATVKFPNREPVTGEFVIDTGAGTPARLNRPFVEEHQFTGALKKSIKTDAGYGIGGRSTSSWGRIDTIEFGGLKFEQPTIHLSHAERGAGANANVAGIIGGVLMKRCKVIFNFKQKQMFLEPNADFDSPFEFDMLGIRWKSQGQGKQQKFVVDNVRDGSAAFKSGIQKGDVLVGLKGVEPGQISIPVLREHAQKHDSVMHMTLKRGDKTIQKDVKLIRIL